ncbi:MAG: 4-alpha-glucanotransferase [Rhodobacteraceae bacterium]|nr:4-alpha-glucanotransferase [Paracoccaceae bacterium]
MTPSLAALAEAAGITTGYHDLTGAFRPTGPETARALLSAMGLEAGNDRSATETLNALRAEEARQPLPLWTVTVADVPARLHPRWAGDWALTLEDGGLIEGHADGILDLPALPLGRHRLDFAGQTSTILSAPDRLPMPPRAWGMMVPLYGLRTEAEGGFGDYRDLGRAVAGLGALGASFVGINPIHAGFPADPGNFSPYAPSSRQRLNVAHIAVDGANGSCAPLIDYAIDLPAKYAALEAAYAARSDTDSGAFSAWRSMTGPGLERFALHQALSEAFGAYWPDWPEAYRRPDSPEVAAFAAAHADRVGYHAWLQFMAETQLGEVRAAAEATGMRYGLYLDLAVGTHPGGAETWGEPQSFARGVSLGAPPDAFAPNGQSWGLAPLDPRQLARTGFATLAEVLRAQFQFAKLLRIDHILGFERAFWVPEEKGIAGAYVTMPRAAMLAVTRIEAARAGATVIGEDLGNVPDGLRGDLAASGILGCRVAMFERWSDFPPHFRAAKDYDENALAAFGSHDLATWAGWREGRDIAWWERIGHMDAAASLDARARRDAEVAALGAEIGTGTRPDDLHAFLGRSRSRLVAVQAEDVLELAEQPNLPGTVFEHPNWRRRLSVPAADLASDPRVVATAALMRDLRPRHD